ncbi:hypothetical protein [Geminisphaera colitermitum]|uniref:hypothetical protein n=1 Tax=Geminisphaera colitermitum TaxID=1148786 RepID=UPI000158D279|nr:hypothetical protein [Geminisphaera colitermitum]
MNTSLKTITCLAAFALGASATQAQYTLINETFSDGARNGAGRATEWWAILNNGTSNAVVTKTEFGGTHALEFYGSSSQTTLIATFAPVTLSKADDYVRISAQTRYDTNVVTGFGANTGPLLGLYNAGSTFQDADFFTPSGAPGALTDDIGYKATKFAAVDAADVKIYKQAPFSGSFFNWAGTALTLESGQNSGAVLAKSTIYTTTLTLKLAANLTDLEITYEIEGGGISHTAIATIAADTFTFNEALIGVFSGQAANNIRAHMSNIVVTTNVPEPTTVAMLIGAASLIPLALRFRHSRH